MPERQKSRVPVESGDAHQRAQRSGLHAADVGHDRVGLRQRPGHLGADVVRGHRDDDQADGLTAVGVTGAQPGRRPEMLGVAVGEQHLHLTAAQRQAQGSTEQAGSDDQDRLRQLTHRRARRRGPPVDAFVPP